MAKLPPYNGMRLKVSLKLAINRLRLLQGKKAAIAKQQRKELSNLLSIGKDESARVRVELTIRDELECELMELLELYCELLLARFGLIESSRECDPGIAEAVCTVIYAAPKSEARELSAVADLLMSKYGRDFSLAALENKENCVNERVLNKLRVDTPSPDLVNRYLVEIARSYNVQWSPNGEEPQTLPPADMAALDPSQLLAEDKPTIAAVEPPASGNGTPSSNGNFAVTETKTVMTSSQVAPAVQSSTIAAAAAPAPDSKQTESPSVPKPATQIAPTTSQPKPVTKPNDSGGEWDDLMSRFEALKKR